ncbi:MAG: response regulator [Deltaproteobacteria bacterium]|nr:response regulator [Deltaproteobacteria bacterium]
MPADQEKKRVQPPASNAQGLSPAYADRFVELSMACAGYDGDMERFFEKALDLLSSAHEGFLDAGAVFLYDPGEEKLLLAAHRGHPRILAACSRHLEPGRCMCGSAASGRQVVYAPSADREPWHFDHRPQPGDHGDLCIPLLAGQGSLVGVIHLLTLPGVSLGDDLLTFTEHAGRFLGSFFHEALRARALGDHVQDLLDRVSQKDDRISELTVSLEHAKRAKSDFLSSMSHELRTPLNAIIGFSQVLQEDYFGTLNDKQKQYVADILESGKHLLNLINDILDLSRVESGVMEPEYSLVNLAGLLDHSATMIREKARKNGVDVVVDLPQELSGYEIVADERKLKQVLYNLLSNAAKFTQEGGLITVGAFLVEDPVLQAPPDSLDEGRTQGMVEIFVQDTGIGIEANDQKRIFEDFYQVSRGLSGKTPGTGLGLPLAKKLVDLHGGELWVKSGGPDKGARFAFRIPVRVCPYTPPQAESQGEKAPESSKNDSDKRVLIVEDSPTNLTLLKDLVERVCKCTVITAADGETAVECVKTFPPDLILMDVGLPGIDGVEALKIIRAQSGMSEVSALAMTGYASSEDEKRLLQNGFNGYLAKPFDLPKLMKAVREFL